MAQYGRINIFRENRDSFNIYFQPSVHIEWFLECSFGASDRNDISTRINFERFGCSTNEWLCQYINGNFFSKPDDSPYTYRYDVNACFFSEPTIDTDASEPTGSTFSDRIFNESIIVPDVRFVVPASFIKPVAESSWATSDIAAVAC